MDERFGLIDEAPSLFNFCVVLPSIRSKGTTTDLRIDLLREGLLAMSIGRAETPERGEE